MSLRASAAGLGLVLALWVGGPAGADDAEIPVRDVPAVAREAATKAAPGVKFTQAYRQQENGKTLFELEGVNADGQETVVVVTPEGKVVEVETEVPPAKLPKPLFDAVKAKFPAFKLAKAYTINRDGKLAEYEFQGTDFDGKEVVITASPDGKTIELEKD